jgi:hypothetical protein
MKFYSLILSVFLLSPFASAKLIHCRGGVAGSFKYSACGPDHYCRLEASCVDDATPKNRKNLASYICKSIMDKGNEVCPGIQKCVDESEKLIRAAHYEKTDEYPK